MLVLLVLLGAWVAFRLIGALGVGGLASWHGAARFALGSMFVFTGVSHFSKVRHEMARMVPRVLPRPMLMVYFTGVCELLGAAGLVIPATRPMAGASLIVLLLVMFPANIRAAREKLTVAGKPATPLWLRAPMQIFFIALLWWAAVQPS